MHRLLVALCLALSAGFTCTSAIAADYPEATDLKFYRFCEKGEELFVCGHFSVAVIQLTEDQPSILRHYEAGLDEAGADVHEISLQVGLLVLQYLEQLPEGKRENLTGLSFQLDKLRIENHAAQGLGPQFKGKRIDITIHRMDKVANEPPPEPKKEEPSKQASRKGCRFFTKKITPTWFAINGLTYRGWGPFFGVRLSGEQPNPGEIPRVLSPSLCTP